MSANQWQPVTVAEVESIVEDDLTRCSSEQVQLFNEHRVPFYQAPIHRRGKVEAVFVVARFGEKVLYFEDIEEGFALSDLDESGAIRAQDCNQFELRHVLCHFTDAINNADRPVPRTDLR